MAIDEADTSETRELVEGSDEEAAALPPGEGEDEPTPSDTGPDSPEETDEEPQQVSPTVGEYTWREFLEEHGHEEAIDVLYSDDGGAGGLFGGGDDDTQIPTAEDWDRVDVDPAEYLGFPPDEIRDRLEAAAGLAKGVDDTFSTLFDPSRVDVVKDEYTWEHFRREFYYNEDGSRPRDEHGDVLPFDPVEHLGFDPDQIEGVASYGETLADELSDIVDQRTVDTLDEVNDDEFFSDENGETTVANRYDLEKAVPMDKKLHFVEEDRYWVNEPYAFVSIFHSRKENEKKYYLIEPYLNEIEHDVQEFLSGKLKTAIKYADEDIVIEGDEDERRAVIERETRKLLDRYDLHTDDKDIGLVERIKRLIGLSESEREESGGLDGIEIRPEPAVIEDDPETLSEYQIEKLLYYLKRDFIGYERIDGIKYDINVEDVSCDGYNSPVFVYHGDYEQIISNVYHGQDELDDFVVKLAQRSGKGISKRRPQVDATLPDGSRSQLTLGKEVSDHGTNYTIRQFKDVPFTPIDLICWKTFSLDEMAFLWLCIENHKSLIFAGGTASGKTTSLNAVSLFIPSDAKIVSIEDTREVELPQRNWIASVTRPSFGDDDEGDVDGTIAICRNVTELKEREEQLQRQQKPGRRVQYE